MMFGNKKVSMWIRGTSGSAGAAMATQQAGETGANYLFIMSVVFLISAALLGLSIVLNEP